MRYPDYLGTDPLVGQKDKVYGLEIGGWDIDRAVGPEDMNTKDAKQYYEAATDVLSLPGTYRSGGTMDDEAEGDGEQIIEAVGSIFANALSGQGSGGKMFRDTLFNTTK